MIKTLLLATSFVIGSGAGTLQKNAPAFNHYAITNTETATTNEITITSENITNRQSVYTTDELHAYGYDQAEIYYNYGHRVETKTFYNAAKIDVSEEYQSWNGKEDQSQEMLWQIAEDENLDVEEWESYYNYYCIVKVTPYTQILNTTINMHLVMPLYVPIQQIYEQDGDYNFDNYQIWTLVTYTTTENIDQKMNNSQIASQFKYDPFDDIQKTRTGYEQVTASRTLVDDLNITNSRNTTPIGALNYVYVNIEWYQDITYNGPTEITYYLFKAHVDYNWKNYNNYTEEQIDIEYGYDNRSSGMDATWDMLKANTPAPPPTDYEIVDIGGLMFDILTMPFAFVSQAFNLTLFPNTAYSINVSSVFLAIFAALTFIFIIKKFIKK